MCWARTALRMAAPTKLVSAAARTRIPPARGRTIAKYPAMSSVRKLLEGRVVSEHKACAEEVTGEEGQGCGKGCEGSFGLCHGGSEGGSSGRNGYGSTEVRERRRSILVDECSYYYDVSLRALMSELHDANHHAVKL